MRKLLSAGVAAVAVAGGALAVGQAAQAQPYGYYNNGSTYSSGYYDRYGHWHSYNTTPYYSAPYATTPYAATPYYSTPYSTPYYSTPYSSYGSTYGYGSNSGLSAGLAMLGSLFGLGTAPGAYSNVPVDQYGPDPNGMIAPDGHRIKCKLRNSYDSYSNRYMTRRECW